MSEGWASTTLGELCDIALGATPARKSPKFWDPDKVTDNVWLSIADMPKSQLHARCIDSKEYLSDEGASAKGRLVQEGTLLVSFKLSLGRLAYAGRDLYTNEAIAALSILRRDLIRQDYLYWYLTFFDWDEAARHDEKLKGKTLNKAKLKVLPVVLPPLPEQERIVSILDEAFAAIDIATTNAEKNLANARELFESQLDNVIANPPNDWNRNELINISTKIGSGATPKGGSDSYISEGIALIRSLNVHDRDFRLKKLAFINDDQADKLKNAVVEPIDVLFNITGASIARCCTAQKAPQPARVNQHVMIVRPDCSIIESDFLCYVLTAQCNKNALLGIGEEGGSTRQAITKKQMQSFLIHYPTLEKQREITASLKGTESKYHSLYKHYQERSLTLSELKQSILHKAFTGELTADAASIDRTLSEASV